MNEESITTEIRKLIEDKIARKEVVVIEWLTNEVVSRKSEIEGPDLPFYRVCAYSHIKDLARRCVKKYDSQPSSPTDSQIVLPGFEQLQVAYSVFRDGANVLVPVDMLSDGELEARAAEYDAMAKGCRNHAREIRKYLRERASVFVA